MPNRKWPAAKPEAVLISNADVYALLSISQSFWYEMLAMGMVGPKPLRLGGKILWKKPEILAWVDARCPPREQWESMQFHEVRA